MLPLGDKQPGEQAHWKTREFNKGQFTNVWQHVEKSGGTVQGPPQAKGVRGGCGHRSLETEVWRGLHKQARLTLLPTLISYQGPHWLNPADIQKPQDLPDVIAPAQRGEAWRANGGTLCSPGMRLATVLGAQARFAPPPAAQQPCPAGLRRGKGLGGGVPSTLALAQSHVCQGSPCFTHNRAQLSE